MSFLFLLYWGYSPIPNMRYSSFKEIGDYEYFTMNIMIGYLLYDTFYEIFALFTTKTTETTSKTASKTKKDNINNKKRNEKKIDSTTIQIFTHHILGLISHGIVQYFQCGIGSSYMMGIYGAEFSTPFLNISWLLIEMGLKDSTIYWVNGLALLATFMWRNVLGGYILYSFYTYSSDWNGSTFSPLTDGIVYWISVAITLCFVGLNLIWTSKLLKKAFGK